MTINYLWKHPNGSYYFRTRVPKTLTDHFKSAQIKKPLNTDSKKIATQRARACKVEFDNLVNQIAESQTQASQFKPDFSSVMKPKSKNPPNESIKHRLITFIDLSGNEVRIDYDGDEKKEIAAYKMLQADQPVQQPAQQPEKSILLSEAIEKYMSWHIDRKKWKGYRTIKTIRLTLNTFVEVLQNDPPIDEITKTMLNDDYLLRLERIPKRYKSSPKYGSLTIEQLLKMNIPKEDLPTTSTIRNATQKVKTLFNWLKDECDLIKTNPAERLTKNIRKNDDDDEGRQGFDKNELKLLFEKPHNFEKPHHYWMRVIALYTGMRIEEIIRIELRNIKKIDGIDCIDITKDDFDGWKPKTKSGIRKVPIHPELVNIGFLKYVKHLRSEGKTRLFEYLIKRSSKIEGVQSFSNRSSEWFTRYRRSIGITESSKVFHSFRHTFDNELKQNRVEEILRGEIMGHSEETKMSKTYTEPFNVQIKYEAICKIKFKLKHQRWEGLDKL